MAAAAEPTTDSREALAALCQIYWNPVYAFIRRKGHTPEDAQDLTQEFFSRLIEKNYLGDANRKRGRFRSFLLTSVTHFLANEWDRARAMKRGGGKIPVSIDAAEAERSYTPTAVDSMTPEGLFERRWALALLERAMARLRAEYAATGKKDQCAVMEGFLNHDSDDAYEQAAGRLAMTAGALRMAVHRMRRKYRDLLRAEIAATVSSSEEIDEEIRFLLSTFN